MNIAIDAAIDKQVTKKLRSTIKPEHNYVKVTLQTSRRAIFNLLAALQKSKFEKLGQESGCEYFLQDDETVAARIGSSVKMFQSKNVQQIKLNMSGQQQCQLFSDTTTCELTVAQRSELDISAQPTQHVVRRHFQTRCAFVNSKGYQYCIRVRTSAPKNGRQALRDAETQLVNTETQVNEFSIEFQLKDHSHPCIYHAINTLKLFLQCFHPKLGMTLSC
ncbi:hypothetical protein OAM67_00655 [bacterium]|nr:hypothetical protein [bacterium]